MSIPFFITGLAVPGLIAFLGVYFSRRASAKEMLRRLAFHGGGSDLGHNISRGASRKSIRDVLPLLPTFLIVLLCGAFFFGMNLPLILFSLCLAYLIHRGFFSLLQKKREKEREEAIEFYLPLVMERMVMAVQAGVDVLSAMQSVIDAEDDSQKLDPVSALFREVCELLQSGLSFEDAMDSVTEESSSTALRHVFLHLTLCHKDGGELVAPLRELSDSSQLFFEQRVEEKIAGLPVKVTFPLLLTFSGLIISYMAIPLSQLYEMGAQMTAGF